MSVLLADTPTRKLRRREYDILVAAGAFEGENVELLFGEIFPMSPQGPAHKYMVWLLRRLIEARLPDNLVVVTHSPVIAADESEPEPDLVVHPSAENRPDRLARTLSFVVEVAKTSQARDTGPKALLYARSGVPEYWVLDLVARTIRVHTGPTATGYDSMQTHPLTADLTLTVASCGDLEVPLGQLTSEAGLTSDTD